MTLKALFVQGRGTGLRAQNWQIWLPWLIGFSTACYHSNLKALGNWFLQWGCYTDKHSPPHQQLQLPRLHTCAWLLPSELWLALQRAVPIHPRSQLFSRVAAAAGWALSQGKPRPPHPCAPPCTPEGWGWGIPQTSVGLQQTLGRFAPKVRADFRLWKEPWNRLGMGTWGFCAFWASW